MQVGHSSLLLRDLTFWNIEGGRWELKSVVVMSILRPQRVSSKYNLLLQAQRIIGERSNCVSQITCVGGSCSFIS